MPERCCECGMDSNGQPSSTSSSNSPQSSSEGGVRREEDKEGWVRILEALETVGEEEMLRKLEECILSGQASNYSQRGEAKRQVISQSISTPE